MFRIISGRWKAKRILAPKNFEVRPTTDFAKEALFSILENKYDYKYCSVMDLFSGIGSITLEFASRECKDIVSVEQNPKHANFIRTTAQELQLQTQINIIATDVFQFLKKQKNTEKKFEIIFADPPFDLPDAQYNLLVDLVLNLPLLKENGVFVLEHQTRNKIAHPNIFETRKYGNVSFSFFSPSSSQNNTVEGEE